MNFTLTFGQPASSDPSRGPNGGLISQHRIALLGSISHDAKGSPKVRASRPRPSVSKAHVGGKTFNIIHPYEQPQ